MRIIYEESGTHPKLQEARDLLSTVRALQEEAHIEGKEVNKKLIPKYSLKVEQDEYNGQPGVRISAYCTNRSDFKAHMKKYGQVTSIPRGLTRSVHYRYHTKGEIILHSGGGYLILVPEDVIHASKQEWEAILQGKIPTHLLSTPYTYFQPPYTK